MATVLIIDDDRYSIEYITQLISEFGPQFDLILSAQSVEEAVYKYHNHSPDLIFLDIQLGNQSGFDFLIKIRSRKIDVIFVTAHDQYAIKAFKFNAITYLLKPIEIKDFKLAMNRYKRLVSKIDLEKRMNELINNINNDFSLRKLTIPSKDGYEFLDLNAIIRLQADGNYTQIFMRDGKKYTVTKTLKVFDELLTGSNFFRVHHSHMINMQWIKKYYKGKGGYIVMEDDTSIEVSVRKKDLFLKAVTDCY